MNRRNFFSRLGLTAAAAVVAPSSIMLAKEGEKQEIRPIDEPEDLRHMGVQSIDPKKITKITPNHTGGSWGSIYKLELDPAVWEEWHKAYGKGFGVRDFLLYPKG